MSPTNQTRQRVMLIAWDLRRGDLAQSFAACLRGAWRFMKALAAYNPIRRARQAGGLVMLSPTLIRSPIARATRSHRYGGQADYKAGRMTARLGA